VCAHTRQLSCPCALDWRSVAFANSGKLEWWPSPLRNVSLFSLFVEENQRRYPICTRICSTEYSGELTICPLQGFLTSFFSSLSDVTEYLFDPFTRASPSFGRLGQSSSESMEQSEGKEDDFAEDASLSANEVSLEFFASR
jgi:hypothetical protein